MVEARVKDVEERRVDEVVGGFRRGGLRAKIGLGENESCRMSSAWGGENATSEHRREFLLSRPKPILGIT